MEAGTEYLKGGLQAVLWSAGRGPSATAEQRAEAQWAYEEAILDEADRIRTRRGALGVTL